MGTFPSNKFKWPTKSPERLGTTCVVGKCWRMFSTIQWHPCGSVLGRWTNTAPPVSFLYFSVDIPAADSFWGAVYWTLPWKRLLQSLNYFAIIHTISMGKFCAEGKCCPRLKIRLIQLDLQSMLCPRAGSHQVGFLTTCVISRWISSCLKELISNLELESWKNQTTGLSVLTITRCSVTNANLGWMV